MGQLPKTYCEDGRYWAVLWVNGQRFYAGDPKHRGDGFKSRSEAYRHAVKEQKRQAHAERSGMYYNARWKG